MQPYEADRHAEAVDAEITPLPALSLTVCLRLSVEDAVRSPRNPGGRAV